MEAAIGVQMAKLDVGPPVVGLEQPGNESKLPAIVNTYFERTITLAEMIENIQRFPL